MSQGTRTMEGGALGWPLLRALEQQRILRSLSRRELAEQLGISPAYLSQLFAGDKPVPAVSLACLRRCAEFLRQPLARCLISSGHLNASDFFWPEQSERDQMQSALEIIAYSRWGEVSQVIKEQLVDLPKPVQWLLIRLYESAAQQCLISDLPVV